MINPKASNQRSDANERVVKEQFEKLNCVVKKLDRKASKGRRPDFLISNSAGRPQILCEVKTVDSAFYPRDKKKYGVEHVHVSTLDDKFRGFFQNIPIDGRAIEKHLADAVDKREALIKDEPQFATLPLLVAFFFDQLATEYLPPFDERFREVSGILMIAEDVERKKAFRKLTDEQQKRHLRAEAAELDRAKLTGTTPQLDDELPPHSKDFVLVPNKTAVRPVPEDFARLCLSDGYYG
jgi:hypothetical protein